MEYTFRKFKWKQELNIRLKGAQINQWQFLAPFPSDFTRKQEVTYCYISSGMTFILFIMIVQIVHVKAWCDIITWLHLKHAEIIA